MRGVWVILLVMLIFQACSESEQVLYTPEFAEDVEDLNLIRNERDLDIFLFRLDSCFSRIPDKKPLDWYEYYNFLAWYERSQNNQNGAILYTDSMLMAVAPYKGVETQYVHALTQKGFLLQEINLFNEALTEFYMANSYADKYLTKCESGEVNYNLGLLLYQQKKYRECIRTYRLSRESAYTCDSTNFSRFYYPVQGALNAEGLCYEKLGLLDSARIMYQQGIDFLERYGTLFRDTRFEKVAKAVIEGNLGNVELILGNLDRAEALLKKSYQVSLETDFQIDDAIYSQIKLAKVYIRQNRNQDYQELLKTIQKELEKYPFREGYYRLYSLESEYFLSQGDSAEAFRTQQVALQYQDSIRLVMNDLSSMNVQTTLSYMEQQEDLMDLRNENERKMIFLLATAIVLMFLGVILWQFRRNLKSSWKHSQELAAVNEELTANNEQLVQTMEALEGSQAENSRIMKIIAHDLRSPIIGVHSLAELLKENQSLDKECKEGLSMIHRISKDSLRFMEDMLNLQGNFRQEEKTSTDLLELVDYCVNFLRLRAEDKKQQLEIEGGHVFVPVYRERIWRVIINLISNAIKFSPEGSTIKTIITETDSTARIEVKDQGVGIPEKMKKQIFDIMGDAKRMGTAGERSFGLGLAISLDIIQSHDGRIWFESEENVGSSFFIELPKK